MSEYNSDKYVQTLSTVKEEAVLGKSLLDTGIFSKYNRIKIIASFRGALKPRPLGVVVY